MSRNRTNHPGVIPLLAGALLLLGQACSGDDPGIVEGVQAGADASTRTASDAAVPSEPTLNGTAEMASGVGHLESRSFRVSLQVGRSPLPRPAESAGILLEGATAVRPVGGGR